MTQEAFAQLLETGILGAMLVLSLMAVVYLFRVIRQQDNERFTELKEIWQKDLEFRAEITNLLNNILDLLRQQDV